MERKNLYFVSVLVVGLLLACAFVPLNVLGPNPAQQHNIWGVATDGPYRALASNTYGGNITAWIDGVCYGYNVTRTDTAEFDLYVDGDWFGLPSEQAEKDGGYDGDRIMYFLDYDPTDYYLSIADWTSFFNRSNYEQVDLFFDTETNTDSGIGNTYLRGLKINEVVLDPADSGNQYVYIYDPGGELDETNLENYYYLQKDDNVAHTANGPIFDFSSYPSAVVRIGTTDSYYINLTGGFTLSSADELKLVWDNPGTSADDIANNTDVIVDRVEWGNYVNYFDDSSVPMIRDYDNTTLVDCDGTPAVGQGYRRTTNGTDTDNCAVDFDVLPETGRPGDVPPPPTVDYIRITDAGGADLMGGPVAPRYVEWGYCRAYNNSAGYLYTVIADWTAEGGDADLQGPTPSTTNGIDVGNQSVTVWLNASYFDGVDWNYDQVMYTVSVGNDIPGSPTNLRVHKGGGAWGATVNDLVLTWTAPTSNYNYLTFNIVYYDTDISNGFQYSNYILFEPNATGAGTQDSCVLPGWLADSNNYVLRVNTTNVAKDDYENMIGTNVGYKYGITLTSSISRIWISIPYFSDYDYVSDIAADSGAEFTNGDIITAVERWNYATQRYDSRLWQFGTWELTPDYDIEPGDALFIAVNTGGSLPYTWKIVGAYDPSLQFDLLKNPTGTSFKMMSFPYHMTYVMASDITAEFPNPNNIRLVGQYNYMTNSWDTRAWDLVAGDWKNDFTLYTAPINAILFDVTATSSYPWQPDIMAF